MSQERVKSCTIEGFKVNYFKYNTEKYVYQDPIETKHFINDIEYTHKEIKSILVRLYNIDASLFENLT